MILYQVIEYSDSAGRRMDGQRDMKKPIAAFRNFVNAPKKVSL